MHITKKPWYMAVKGHKVMMITCSDGKTYSCTELAKIIGIHQSTLSTRIKKDWTDPDICKKKVFRKKPPMNLDHIPKGDLTHLSSKKRNPEIKTKPTTDYEKELWK